LSQQMFPSAKVTV